MTLAVSYNQPKFCPTATWNPTTFANESTVGTYPYSVFVDTNNTVYVTNPAKAQIFVWLNEMISLIRTVSDVKLNPYSIFVTITGDIYFSNLYENGRVIKWSLNTNITVLVMHVNSSCTGIFVDINDTLYCSMCDHHQVVKKWLHDNTTAFTIVAGMRIPGNASNMLIYPYGIFVDINFDLYVADCNNNRIQLFQSGQMNGTTVAGSGSSKTTITLSCPVGVVLDADKYFFIVDRDNHRIIGSGPNGFRCLVGCSDSRGSAANQLQHPTTLSFDSFGNMFVNDQKNGRIQKFFLSTNSCGKYGYALLYSTMRIWQVMKTALLHIFSESFKVF